MFHGGSLDRLVALLPFLVPAVLIDLALIVYALIDLFRQDRRVQGDNKLIWALVILFVSTLGPLVYLLVGRKDV
ncbi:MAG TPA: PLD nuclease N-terminal domain-containing protein [Ktedonobacterales bacterium]